MSFGKVMFPFSGLSTAPGYTLLAPYKLYFNFTNELFGLLLIHLLVNLHASTPTTVTLVALDNCDIVLWQSSLPVAAV